MARATAPREKIVDIRRVAVDVIDLMHLFYSYRELSLMLGLPSSMISRYLRGRSMPSKSHAERILDIFSRNRDMALKLTELIKSNPDSLYDSKIVNSLIAIILRKTKISREKFDSIIAFNDPTILFATRLRETLLPRTDLIVLYYTPLVPESHTECFSITPHPITIFACTKPFSWRARKPSRALLIYPILISAKEARTLTQKIVEILRIRDITPLLLLCPGETSIYKNALCIFTTR